ncbi:MAG: nickel-dependent lactate racemase [Planctomycetota bacterium]|jgi:nickel-dependent lactate racemase|nr:nickel-dependent lactate racemase [Planctomycetota bacterium]
MKNIYSIKNVAGRIHYSDAAEGVDVPLPEGMECTGLAAVDEPAAADAKSVLADSLAAPINSPPLRELARGRRSAAVIVSDSTRAVATARALPFIVDELLRGGLSPADVFLIVAVGVHRPANRKEMREIAGELAGTLRIVNHDPYGAENLKLVGITSRGTRVEINRLVAEADLRLSIGKVETHEFAGYSGGRKSILPGVASEKTILYNHRPEMIADPAAVPGRLAGNPIHEDMLEAAKLAGLDFCLNVVQNASGSPIAAFAGAPTESHAAAVAYYAGRYGVGTDGRANIHLTTPGAPLNIDLYQSMKPFFGLYPVLKRGDVIVLYSECREGVNSDDMLKPFEYGPNLDGIMDFLLKNYRIQMDHALLFCKLLRKGIRVIAHSPGVRPEVFRHMMMTPAESVEHALVLARDIMAGDGVVPRLRVAPMAQRLIFA